MITALTNWIKKHPLISFFALTYLIMFGVNFTFIYLNPGQPMQPWSLVWFLQVFSPTFGALIVAGIIGGMAEVRRLLSGLTRWNVGLRWYLAAAFLFLGPLATALIYIALGNPISAPQPVPTAAGWLGLLVFSLFSGPIAEELGWRGFALPRLQTKYNALVSSLILGVIHCCWHIPLYFIPESSQQGIPFPIYLVLVVTLTIYMTWLYNNTRGSLIITILAHLSFNMTGFITGQLGLMPPMLLYMTVGPMLALIVVAILFVFGPRTLSKKPAAELPFQPEAAALVSGD